MERGIQLASDDSLLNSMKAKLTSTCAKSSPSFTICRVPAHIRNTDHPAYSPRIISIGPFHRQSTNLQDMEQHKWRYLLKFLGPEYELHLQEYLTRMELEEARTRDCYSEEFRTIGSADFKKMMVLDGCFVLQFIYGQNHGGLHLEEWRCKLILHDMLLLENQLPFFVLECLWELSGQPRATLKKKASTFFRRAFPHMLELNDPELEYPERADHILHLLHAVHLSKTVQQSSPESKPPSIVQQSSPESKPPSMAKMVPCAMRLQEAGFKFQRKKANSFLDVTFEKGLMKMPPLWIDGDTNVLFRNFIAFEQCFPDLKNHFTSYCCLIDALVNTAKDVSILTQSKIIEPVGCGMEVAHLFNALCKEVTCDYKHSYLASMYEEVNQHTQKRCPKWWAKLVRDYFGNPCAIISLIAAIIILIAGLVQAFFAVFAYFRPQKP